MYSHTEVNYKQKNEHKEKQNTEQSKSKTGPIIMPLTAQTFFEERLELFFLIVYKEVCPSLDTYYVKWLVREIVCMSIP
jgi:hypothetical protein